MAELDEREASAMPRVETIRGLERGLQVLKFLHSEPISSLHEIHAATAISKPSLLRILNTLERAGMVARRLADGRYRLSVFTDVVRKQDRYDRVAEAAAPVLARLCQEGEVAVRSVRAGRRLHGKTRDECAAQSVRAPRAAQPGWWPGGVADDGRRARLSRVVSGEGTGGYFAHTPEIQQPGGLARARPEEARANSQ